MTRVWHTADLHIGHRLVSGLRGFADTDAHDATLTEHWRATVAEDDIVYVLGDVAVSRVPRAIEVVASLPGRKRLIAGNHDAVHPMHRDAPKWDARYREAFEWIAPFGRRRIGGHDVLLSHFPYGTLDHTEEPRYLQWRLSDMGQFLLHGHTHSTEIRTSEREIHVGWDSWGRLVPEHEIATLLEGE